jgi:NitT/TauT family transport system substrate-binding protein
MPDVESKAMSKFIIEPHFRLHEWVAEEKRYFESAGLDYEFRETVQSSDGAAHRLGDKIGAFQTFERGRRSDVRCACHWTVNVAASKGHGKLFGHAYSVSPCGVFVSTASKVKTPADLVGVPISVGYQSGSHYATIQALEQYMSQDTINLSFKDGLLFGRMELLLDGKVPACTLFSGPYYFAEQLGFRKIIDCTFMMATMITGNPEPEDVRKYFSALRKAQRDIDLRPDLYTHYYKREFPKRFLDRMDTRRWGPGERIVFEPYSREVFEESRIWIRKHGIFDGGDLGGRPYEEAVVTYGGLDHTKHPKH